MIRIVGLVGAVMALTLTAGSARAEQRADYMLTYERPGLYLYNDFFGTGLQTTLEHRMPVYGKTNGLTTRLQSRLTYPLGELNIQADIRLIFLVLGGQIGYRTTWRNIRFAPDEPLDRGHRRKRDALFAGDTNTNSFLFAETRAQIIAPLNEYVLFYTTATLRWEGGQDRSFDWLYTVTHDSGILGAWEAMLLLKNRHIGGWGPYVQWLSFPLDGERHDQWAVGFTGARRLGLFKRNDLLFVTALIRPGDDAYGQHNYFMPVRGLITYRFTFEL